VLSFIRSEKGPEFVALAGINPRVYLRTSKRPKDSELRNKIQSLASERQWFGDQRLHTLLKREGWEVNWMKLCRFYREE
jgi:putative transposase